MQTQTTQIRVTLPLQMQGYLQTKADTFGLSLSAYVRSLILNDVQNIVYPIRAMSKSSIDLLESALEDERSGNLIESDSIDELFAD